MKVEVIEDLGGFTQLLPEWRELLEHSASACPFLTPEWLGAWCRSFVGRGRLHVMAIRDQGEVVAIAPLVVTGKPMFRRLEFLGTGLAGSDYLDIIVRAGYERNAVRELALALGQLNPALRLSHATNDSTAVRLAHALVDSGWTMKTADAGTCPVVPLEGQTWDSYLASLGSSHRANFRRRLRALDQEFDVRFEPIATDAERRVALDALIRFHGSRFGARGSTAFLTPAAQTFHEDATSQALRDGWLRMYALRLDDAIAAVMYGFMYRRRFYFYQHGFDPQYARMSVGLVLMGLTIQAALAEGAIEFDMLWGTETYKSLWARDRRHLVQVQLFPPHLGGVLQRRTAEAGRHARLFARRLLAIGAARAS